MKKILKIFLLVFTVCFLAIFAFLFVGSAKPAENIVWGGNFSQKYAGQLGLDWKKTYLALLDDLGVKNVKAAVHWDILEPKQNEFYFDDLDWQVSEAGKRGVKIILVIGMKTSRWPECHIPDWAESLSKKEQQEKILRMVGGIVLRYGNDASISAWQVENEPFFPFGECPWADKEFVEREVKEVHELDSLKRPVIISDSGEGSFWINAAKIGDIVGATMYKKVWFSVPKFLSRYLGSFNNAGLYIYYPLPPVFYGRKAEIVKKFFNKEVIVIELQAEPWAYKFITELPPEEQEKTMTLDRFRENVAFAKKTGLPEFYLWGMEWMYWMKEKQNRPEIWEEAKKLFNE
jgi:hypothetical protein